MTFMKEKYRNSLGKEHPMRFALSDVESRFKKLLQASSQKFAFGGGLFWRLETTLNNLDPDFHWSSLRLSQLLSPNSGDFHKKKVFTEIETGFLFKFCQQYCRLNK